MWSYNILLYNIYTHRKRKCCAASRSCPQSNGWRGGSAWKRVMQCCIMRQLRGCRCERKEERGRGREEERGRGGLCKSTRYIMCVYVCIICNRNTCTWKRVIQWCIMRRLRGCRCERERERGSGGMSKTARYVMCVWYVTLILVRESAGYSVAPWGDCVAADVRENES